MSDSQNEKPRSTVFHIPPRTWQLTLQFLDSREVIPEIEFETHYMHATKRAAYDMGVELANALRLKSNNRDHHVKTDAEIEQFLQTKDKFSWITVMPTDNDTVIIVEQIKD